MNKYLKWGLIIAVVIGGGLYVAYLAMVAQTKSYSPEETVTYNLNGYNIEVFYNRPYKKGRKIFGGLVPYNRVWRTGANEATTFETSSDLDVAGQVLKAGKYTLWTIPREDNWSIIFNDKQYSWGVKRGGGAARDPEHDVLEVKVPTITVSEEVEQFTIHLTEQNRLPVLSFTWDKTYVELPMEFYIF